MNKKICLFLGLSLSLVSLLCFLERPSASVPVSNLASPSAGKTIREFLTPPKPAYYDDVIRRERRVVDANALIARVEAGYLPQAGDVMRIEFFEDKAFDLHVRHSDLKALGEKDIVVVRGSTSSDGLLTASYIVSEGKILAVVDDYENDRGYMLAYDFEEGAYFAQETDKTKAKSCGGAKTALSSPGDAVAQAALCVDTASDGAEPEIVTKKPLASGKTTIDYLATFDTNAADYAKRNGGLVAWAETVVASMNNVFDNSGVFAQYNLVGVEELGVTQNFFDSNCLYYYEEYRLGGLRDKYLADLVQTFINPSDPELGGLGYCPGAYSMVVARWAGAWSNYTSAHECGHNLGCGHAKEQTQSPGEHEYANGAYSKSYASVMAYESDASDGIKRQRAPIFSGPSSYWKGELLGSATANNTRMAKSGALTTSAYRELPELSLYPQSVTLEYTRDSRMNLTVTNSGGPWFYWVSASWFSFEWYSTPTCVSSEEENPESAPRVGLIRFCSDYNKARLIQTLKVTQKGNPNVLVSSDMREYRFAKDGGSVEFDVELKTDTKYWTADKDFPAWITRTYKEGKVTLTAEGNSSGMRSCDLWFVGGDADGNYIKGSHLGINLSQEGIDPDSLNALALKNNEFFGALDDEWLYQCWIDKSWGPDNTPAESIRIPEGKATGEIYTMDEDWLTSVSLKDDQVNHCSTFWIECSENTNYECRETFIFFKMNDGGVGAIFVKQLEN